MVEEESALGDPFLIRFLLIAKGFFVCHFNAVSYRKEKSQVDNFCRVFPAIRVISWDTLLTVQE
jgi:hypothetical protein